MVTGCCRPTPSDSMRPHRAFSPVIQEQVELFGPEAKHLLEVLRARPGDKLTLFDGKGTEATAIIEAVASGHLWLKVVEKRQASREPPVPVELYVALLKGDKLSEVVRAATELGVSKIILIITVHSVAKEMGESKLQRLRRVAVEAAKQSERSLVPLVAGPIPISEVPGVKQGLVAHPGTSRLVQEILAPGYPVSLATGPEGGFSDAEVLLLEAKGFTRVSLGPRILRAETAAISLVSLVTAGAGV